MSIIYLKQGNCKRTACEFRHKDFLAHAFSGLRQTKNEKLSSSFQLSKTMLLAIVLLISSWPNFKHVTVDDSQTLFSRPLWLMKEFGLNWNHLWLLFNVVYWFLFKPEFISGAPTISNLEIWTLRRSVLNDKVVTKHAQLHELVAIKWKLYCNHQVLCCWS